MSEPTNLCKNCNASILGVYCHSCGQRAKVHNVTFKETFGDLADGMFSIQAPVWKTLKDLAIRPGHLLQQFLVGKRKLYYKPVSFFILMSAIYLLVRWIIGFDILSDTTIKVGNAGDSEILNKARAFMLVHIDKFLFLLVLSMSLLLKLLFYRRYSLAEYFAVSFYLVAVYMVVQTINIVYLTYVDSTHQWFGIVIGLIYFCFAIASFLKRPKFWIVLKSIFVYLIAFGLYMSLAFGISVLIAAITRS